MKSYIGTVLEFSEHTYQRTVSAWEQRLLPQLSLVARQYSALELGSFTQCVWEDILAHQTRNIRAQYEAIVRQDIRGFKTAVARDTVLQNIDGYIRPLEQSIEELLLRKEKAQGLANSGALPLYWEDCTIVESTPVLNKESIRRRCEVVIQSEEESTLYHHLLTVQQAWDALKKHLQDRGFDASRCPLYGHNGFFMEGPDGSLVLISESLKGL